MGNYVKMEEANGQIIISMIPVNDDTTYSIEFNNEKSLETLFYAYPERRFVRYLACTDKRIDRRTGKAYIDVSFENMKKLANHVDKIPAKAPFAKLVLKQADYQVAERVFEQLMEQVCNLLHKNDVQLVF
jgi:hypothetical protein